MIVERELARKAIHLGVGGLAFLLKYLTPWQAASCAAAAVLFNRFVLPAVGGTGLFRGEERRHPWRSGIVIYPISVLVLIVLFHDRIEVAAAGWGIMAAGDAAAGVIGGLAGRHPLPWNRSKSLEGSVGFVAGGSVAAGAVLAWFGHRPLEAGLLGVAASLFGAIVESLPWRLDDNLTVPLLAALLLRGLLEIDPSRLRSVGPAVGHDLLWGIVINLVLALLALGAGTVDRSGTIAGFVVGTATYAFSGWRGFLVLLTFFVLGSAATRLGYRRKARAGIAQARKGARSARHALANCGVGVVLAFLLVSASSPGLFALAFVCAYATAVFDTVSSEVGQAYGGRPILITTLRPVPAGTNGAISWVGTLSGALAALAVGGVASMSGLLPPGLMTIVALAALAGSTADSFLGATLEARGLMDNEAVNFSNTLVGALSGVGLAALMSAPL
jgi:uncharacterized protein (TIGR00297 family)